MKFRVLDKYWTIYLFKEDDFNSIVGSEADAETDTDTNTITFRKEKLNINVIRHELFHAYFDSTCTDSAHLDAEQTEEVAATLMERYLDRYVKDCSELYEELKNEL